MLYGVVFDEVVFYEVFYDVVWVHASPSRLSMKAMHSVSKFGSCRSNVSNACPCPGPGPDPGLATSSVPCGSMSWSKVMSQMYFRPCIVYRVYSSGISQVLSFSVCCISQWLLRCLK